MKKLISVILLLGVVTQVHSLSPKLNKTMELFKECMSLFQVPLCDKNFDAIKIELKNLGTDPRGEFVYVLKDVLKKNKSKEVILNLNQKLQELVDLYLELDSSRTWAGRDILVLQGTVSTESIRFTPVNAKILEELFVKQKNQQARYKFMGALHGKSKVLNKRAEIEELMTFTEFAKDHIKKQGDEFYVYSTAVDLIKKLTVKNLAFVRGFEGVYNIELLDPKADDTLKIDRVVVTLSNEKNGLIVNFASSRLKVTKFSFKGAGLLGNTAFSNQKVYVSSNELVAPGFKFNFNFETFEVEGTFYSNRFGNVKFKGTQLSSNSILFQDQADSAVGLDELVGEYRVSVGPYYMTLKIGKNEHGDVTATLINDNALIVFNNVTFNKEYNVFKALDWKLEKVLQLKVSKSTGAIELFGQYLNSKTSRVYEVKN